MLTRHTPLERGKALRANGRKSAKRRKATHERCFGAPRPGDGDTRDAAVRRMRCLALGRAGHVCDSPVQAAHVRARGMGGAKGDRFDLIPLCRLAHREAGELPSPGNYHGSQREAWELKHGVRLRATAAALAQQLTDEGYP